MLKHAIRLFRRSPRNSATAAAILALAIGTNTVMFSAIKLGIVPPRKEEVPAAAGSYVRVGSEKL